MTHDETKLPRWARNLIDELRHKIERRDALVKAHAALTRHRHWFTISGHDVGSQPWNLYELSNDGARPVCSIGAGDVLLVGRAR